MNQSDMTFEQRQAVETKTLPYAQVLLSKIGFDNVISTVGTQLDFKYATDFTADLNGASKNIAYRCRNRNAFEFKDIGFRCTTNNNTKTELDKIQAGYVDYYLYVYLRKDSSFCYNYFMIDIQFAINNLEKKEKRVSALSTPSQIRKVKDASFAQFNLNDLKRYIVVNSFIV